jgi:branched-chain amino acid transport system substrate-binding protein
MHKKTVSAFVAVVAVIVLAAGCSSSGSGSSTGSAGASASAAPSASTISVSVTCPISGPNPVPECATSVQAYFDQVNAGGGVDGHKLKAVICDTQLNPVTEADCLKNAIANPSIVAFVGHGNLVVSPDTAIADIGTFTLTPAMSMAPNDFALSSYAGTTGGALGSILLQQLLLDKGFRKPGIIACSVTGCINDVKGAQAFYATKGITVKAVTAANTAVDLTPQMTSLQHAGVNAVQIAEPTVGIVGALKAAGGLGYTPAFNLSFTADDTQTLAQLPAVPNLYVPTPFNPAPSARSAYTQLMNTYIGTGKWTMSVYGLNGYLSAQVFVADLKGISGPITRASVLAGMKKVTDFSSPLLGMPIDFAQTGPVAKYPSIYNWYWYPAQVSNHALVPTGGAVNMAPSA